MAGQPRQVRMMHNIMRMQQQVINNQMAIVATQQRGFGGKKKKKAKQTEDEPSEYEDVEEPVAAAPEPVPEPVVEEKPDFSAAT